MNLLQQIKILAICITMAASANLSAQTLALNADEVGATLPDLERNHGYLLLHLDVGGIAPSFDYLSTRYKRASQKRVGTISLKDKEPGFYLIPMAAGTYQITRISAPYYNLPFRLDTSSTPLWEFEVDALAINYFGLLEISNMRSEKTVYVDRKNRIASDLVAIEEKLKAGLAKYPLVVSSAYRDDFYSVFRQETMTAEESSVSLGTN